MGLSKCEAVVIDECDTLLNFRESAATEALLKPVLMRRKARPHSDIPKEPVLPCKFIMVSATLPVALSEYLDTHFPQIKKLTTPTLHKTVVNCQQQF